MKQDYRWINDPHERPDTAKKASQPAVDAITFDYFKKAGKTPEEILDKDLATRYSAWLNKKS
jgi:hypothetical protein